MMMLDENEKRQMIAMLSPAQKRLLLEKARIRLSNSEAEKAPTFTERRAESTLSYAQRAMWLHEQLNPGSSAYNVSLTYRFSGVLNVSALRTGLAVVIERHAILRSIFPNVGGKPHVQLIADLEPELLILDLRHIEQEDVKFEEASRTVRKFHTRPFALDRAPLLRSLVIRLRDAEFILAFSLPHLACDGASLPIFLQELGEAYHAAVADRTPVLPLLPAQYGDFVRWQNDWLTTGEAQRQLDYWKTQLADLPSMQMQRGRPEENLTLDSGARAFMALSSRTSSGIARLASNEETTHFAILLAALNVLVGRYCGSDDVVIGAPFEGRTQSKFENLVGPFINPLPLRTDISGEPTFRELVQRVKKTVIGALQNQNMPLDRILAEVRPLGDAARKPLFQIFLNRYQLPEAVKSFPELSLVAIPKERFTPKFDLSLFLATTSDSASIAAVYNKNVFDDGYIHGFLNRLLELLEEIVEDPDLPISTYLPVRVITSDPRAAPISTSPPASSSIDDAFERIAQIDSTAPAVIDGELVITYGELRSRKEVIRERLIQSIGKEQLAIGVMSNSDVFAISAVLGVLAARCHFVPLDPINPDEKLLEIAKTCEISVVLASDVFASRALQLFEPTIKVINLANLSGELVAEGATERCEVDPNAEAYILFTSGSTGRPKGVVQSNANAVHHAITYAKSLDLQKSDRVSLLAWFGFDAGIMDIFGALLTGAAVVPLRLREISFSGAAQVIFDRNVTILHPTPTVFRYLVKALGPDFKFSNVRAVILGGEEALASDFELFKKHFVDGALLVNGLGPSESTLALQHRMGRTYEPSNGILPVGFPVDQTEVLLLNRSGQEVGLFAPGEIVIKSRYVALGYYKSPEQTQRAFSTDLLKPDVRLYRTGDFGRRLEDGSIEFVGRADRQVKIRGMKVDLLEIQSTLSGYEGVSQCAVVLEDASEKLNQKLLAYCTVVADVSPIQLRTFLRAKLPEHMVPSEIVVVENLPLLPNGKLDRRALPKPPPLVTKEPPRTSRSYISTTERTIAEAWVAVLDGRSFDHDDNFFDVGGHSLLFAEMFSILDRRLPKEFTLVDLLRYPTVSSFHDFIVS